MESFRESFDLAAELRTLRPAPSQAFAAELDERAAAGFPRRPAGDGSRPEGFADRFFARLRGASPRRVLLPAGGVALAAIAVATTVVAVSEKGSLTSSNPSVARPAPGKTRPAQSGAGSSGTAHEGRNLHGGGPYLGSLHVERATSEASKASSAAATAGAASSSGRYSGDVQLEEVVPSRLSTPGHPKELTGPYASHTRGRDVERAAQMVLGTDPDEVRSAAAKVFDEVHSYDGIVLRSSVHNGVAGEAGASFELLIPSGKLGDALAAFSSIAEVRSRHESTADVTARTVSLGERLQDGRAAIQGLLRQLAAADTDAERTAAEMELRSERLRVASLRSRLNDLQRRTNLSRVSLKIETGEDGAGPAAGDSSWGIGDALSDAGHILAIAAGVTLIGLAVLVPIALLCLLAWLAHRAWLRRQRERALS
jgi:hypothetical protein